MLGWMKHKLESRLPGEISITSDMKATLKGDLLAEGTKPKANCLPLINAVTGTSSPFQRADVHLVPQLT